MIGYHYTPTKNLPSIMEAGLVPKPLDSRQFGWGLWDDMQAVGITKGVFVFTRQLSGRSLLGTLMYHFGKSQGETAFFCLRVRCNQSQIAFPKQPGKPFRLIRGGHEYRMCGHDGFAGGVQYHVSEPIVLLASVIEPERLKVVAEYDLMRAIEEETIRV